MITAQTFDVIVIGAGHAGIEAALAAARLGAKTAVFTLSLDAVGNMPCNPSIGGTAKSHLVFELDALGGEMAKAADATTLQSRMLNLKKGPAVHSLRTQIDRRAYSGYMKRALERQESLYLIQDEVVDIAVENGAVSGVVTAMGALYGAKAVVVATGTYLGGKIYVGEMQKESGPDGVAAATALGENLKEKGLPMRRFKTGTPARVHRRSIDFSALAEQRGDKDPQPFSAMTDFPIENKVVCHISYTNERTHELIRQNLDRSPLFGGKITGIGARYCPSIEDKVVRFSEKPRHQLFIEPCGESTDEMYLQGMSSSLPLDVQQAMYETMDGLANVEIMRPAYAIEYDCIDPLAMGASLELKDIAGLFGAGQFNGTSGYEEAAAQGFVAGVNAARKTQNKEPVIFERAGSYIGTLIDDLVTKGVNDPYRMMTSRSEYRLLLRQDNAESRMTELGREIGLVDDERYARYLKNEQLLSAELERAQKTIFPPNTELNAVLKSKGAEPVTTGASLAALLKRPNIGYADLEPIDTARGELPEAILRRAEIELKYEGYIKRQQAEIEKQKKLEQTLLPDDIDYRAIDGLRLEAREKLAAAKPRSLGAAGRISGVNPADLGVLSVWLAKRVRRGE